MWGIRGRGRVEVLDVLVVKYRNIELGFIIEEKRGKFGVVWISLVFSISF